MPELTLPQLGGSRTLDELEELARRQSAASLPPHADLDAAAAAARQTADRLTVQSARAGNQAEAAKLAELAQRHADDAARLGAVPPPPAAPELQPGPPVGDPGLPAFGSDALNPED